MVPWWKRGVYGLIGWVTASCVIGVFVSIWIMSHLPAGIDFSVRGFVNVWLLFVLSALAVGVWGWLLGIPFVSFVKDTVGRRFWANLAIGSLIGPDLLLTGLLYEFLTRSGSGSGRAEPVDYGEVFMSASVSTFTTLIYLFLLRRAQLARKPS